MEKAKRQRHKKLDKVFGFDKLIVVKLTVLSVCRDGGFIFYKFINKKVFVITG